MSHAENDRIMEQWWQMQDQERERKDRNIGAFLSNQYDSRDLCRPFWHSLAVGTLWDAIREQGDAQRLSDYFELLSDGKWEQAGTLLNDFILDHVRAMDDFKVFNGR